MPEKELDLLQLPSGLVAEASARATEIMGRDRAEVAVRRRFANNGPDDLGCKARVPNFAALAHRTKENPTL